MSNLLDICEELMAWMYVELFRKGDDNNLVGHIVKIFDDGVIPEIPQPRSRQVRIEITNRNASQIRTFLDSGIGRIKLNSIPDNIKNQLRNTRTLSINYGQISEYLTIDRNPNSLPIGTVKVRLLVNRPDKPRGTMFVKLPGEKIFRCLTDQDSWFDESLIQEMKNRNEIEEIL